MKQFLLAGASFLLLGGLALGADPGVKTGAAAAAANKTPTLAQMLTYAIQDEWAARAEYEAVLKKWPDAKPFANIIRSEESHISWLTPLFAAHGLPAPVEPKPGVIVPKDWTQALSIGAEAEVVNIAMYEQFLKQTLPEEVRTVFVELKKASENHLKAFRTGGQGRR